MTVADLAAALAASTSRSASRCARWKRPAACGRRMTPRMRVAVGNPRPAREALVAHLTPLGLAMNREAEAINREAYDVAVRLDRLDRAPDGSSFYDRQIAVVALMDKRQA